MDAHERSTQARFGKTCRLQLDPFRNRTIVTVWCIAPAGLKIAEAEMPLNISLNMQNDVMG